MNRILQILFFLLIVKPIVYIFLGLSVRNRYGLPEDGPVIIVANHNSHLDTVVVMSLFPLWKLHRVRPVAAADYWLKTPFLTWLSQNIIGIIPIDREGAQKNVDILGPIVDALELGHIVIIFPEGSRGEPEQLSAFKSGIAHLSRRCPDVPVIPIFLRGLGKALPKGESLLLPYFCDVNVGTPFKWNGNRRQFMQDILDQMHELAERESTSM